LFTPNIAKFYECFRSPNLSLSLLDAAMIIGTFLIAGLVSGKIAFDKKKLDISFKFKVVLQLLILQKRI